MRGRRGLFSLFTSLPDHPEDRPDAARSRRRRRHSSGDRETWSRKVEYFFASLGYAVGLGNIWRFPYLCYRNGGGAFLIPYLLSLILVGFPMVFLEMSFGQFASLGPVTIWRVSPLFKGIGYSIVIVLVLVNTYYNVLCAYALYYLFASVTDELPWSHCKNPWNTDMCISPQTSTGNGTIEYIASENRTTTMSSLFNRNELKTPTEEFFENHLLRRSSGIDELGSIQWPLIVCLIVSWFTCFMCLFKGIKSMGKAVIFTTLFSYFILTVLFIRGVTLPGAAEGIIFYLKPNFSKLGELSVWGEASAQAFASLTLGGGGWITLSSYNKFNNKCSRDAIMVGIGNALTSFYSGFVIFSVLGYMAYIKGVPVDSVTAKGPGLAFVAYPEGLALIPGAPLWSVCFFFMMFTVGLDSLFGQVETIAAGVIDEYPDYLRPRRKLFTLFLCGFMFFLGLPLVTQGGIYVVALMDWYTLLFSFSIICLFEIIVIIYIYGYDMFAGDIEIMLGKRPNMYYSLSWRFITPLILMCVIIFLAVMYVPVQYGNYEFPAYAESIGWVLALGPTSLIPLTALFMFIWNVGSFDRFKGIFTDADVRQDLKEKLIHPSEEWGPMLPEIRRKYSYDQRAHNGTEAAELVAVRSQGDEDDKAVTIKDGDTKELQDIPEEPVAKAIEEDSNEAKA